MRLANSILVPRLPMPSSSMLRPRPMARTAAPPHQRRLRPSRTSATTGSDQQVVQRHDDGTSSPQGMACRRLMHASGTTTSLEMRPSKYQNGLFTTTSVRKGDVLMSVPRHICFIIDYNQGLNVPSRGAWPRLKEGLNAEEPMTWDLLMALALLDGLAGDGDSFWQGYCQAILPAPESLTLPMCWSKQRLQQLQHSAIAEAAMQQQARLAALLPDLAEPVAEDAPSWLQWAFACVRSRAYKLGPEVFAMVPFWDLANHDVQPNSDFRAEPVGAGAAGALQLIALKDMAADQEVLISYTGAEGYTNQRLMAQYGFVLPGGNPADRVPLEVPEGSKSQRLSLERIQQRMGDLEFLEIISAQDAYGYAALKSLPLMDENTEVGSSDPARPETSGTELAAVLIQQCVTLEQGYATSLQEDEQVLQRYRSWKTRRQQRAAAVSEAGSEEQAAEVAPLDEREASALEYRVERKRLISACRSILQLYVSESFKAPQQDTDGQLDALGNTV